MGLTVRGVPSLRSLLSSGAPPRKCGLPSQPPASLSKSHCSWLGRERPNLPPWPWSPLHPLPIQNQFIWVILKARRLGQLEPVSGQMLGVSSSLKPTCSVCWRGRGDIAKTGNEGLANQASQQLPGFGAGRKPHFLVRWLGPKRQATELCSKAFQLSATWDDLGIRWWIRLSGYPGQHCVLALKKVRWFSWGSRFALFALVSSSSGVASMLLRGLGDSDFTLETRRVK